MRRLTIACLAILLLWPTLTTAAQSNPQRCDAIRIRALATLAKKQLLCRAQAIKLQAPVSSDCTSAANAAFARAVAGAQRGTCDGAWDAAAIATAVADLIAPTANAQSTGNGSRCGAKKLKGAGLRAASALRAWGDYRSDFDLDALRDAMTKATATLLKRVEAAERLDDCATNGDAAQLEQAVNDVVEALILEYAAPAATTETLTATAAGGRLSFASGIAVDIPPKAFLSAQTARLTLISSTGAQATALSLVTGVPIETGGDAAGAFNLTIDDADPEPLLPLTVVVPLPANAAPGAEWSWRMLSANPASLQRDSLPCEWQYRNGTLGIGLSWLTARFPPEFFSDRCRRYIPLYPRDCHGSCGLRSYVVNGAGAPIYDARLSCLGCESSFEGGGLNALRVPLGTSHVSVTTACGSATIPLPVACPVSSVCVGLDQNLTVDFADCLGNFAGSWRGTFRSVQSPDEIYGDFRASIRQSGATIVGIGAVDISVFGVELAGSMTGTASGSNVAVGLAFGPMPGQEITFHGQMTSNPARIIGTYENSLDSGTWEAYRQ